jgi:hypothetical protein
MFQKYTNKPVLSPILRPNGLIIARNCDKIIKNKLKNIFGERKICT